MPSALALGWGTVTGTRASPQTLWSGAVEGPVGVNAFLITNLDTAKWLFVRDPVLHLNDVFILIPPGETRQLVDGKAQNGIRKIVGFATTASEAGTTTLIAAGAPNKQV